MRQRQLSLCRERNGNWNCTGMHNACWMVHCHGGTTYNRSQSRHSPPSIGCARLYLVTHSFLPNLPAPARFLAFFRSSGHPPADRPLLRPFCCLTHSFLQIPPQALLCSAHRTAPHSTLPDGRALRRICPCPSSPRRASHASPPRPPICLLPAPLRSALASSSSPPPPPPRRSYSTPRSPGRVRLSPAAAAPPAAPTATWRRPAATSSACTTASARRLARAASASSSRARTCSTTPRSPSSLSRVRAMLPSCATSTAPTRFWWDVVSIAHQTHTRSQY